MEEEGAQGSHSASCTSRDGDNIDGDETRTGQSWGKGQQVCRMLIVRMICCLQQFPARKQLL